MLINIPNIAYIFRMETGSHYYGVLALCRMLGIRSDLAGKIAYASQFVDDALIRKIVFKHTPHGIRCHIFGNRRGLDHAATCPRIMTVWNYRPRVMFEELVPFHFIPAGRGANSREKIRTFPDSPLLKILKDAAIESGNIYQLGIVLHVLADAHAHQGFSGMISRRNRLKDLRVKKDSIRGFNERIINYYMIYVDAVISRLFGRILPIYSHSHAGTLPDIASAEWEYRYDTGQYFIARYRHSGKISNPGRFRDAFEEMKELLIAFCQKRPDILEKKPDFQDYEAFYRTLTQPMSARESGTVWQHFLLEKDLLNASDSALSYDPHAWLRKAFKNYKRKKFSHRIVSNAVSADNFASSDWYAFYLASRDYKEHYERLVTRNFIF
ncbi:MAG: DUF6765 family protein [Candidatus Neomarinimicrobiota bacterium]|jgi:hypothetical protein|nr:hypothetical protein [Candidatus Neomarinimicrobiota bacterium]